MSKQAELTQKYKFLKLIYDDDWTDYDNLKSDYRKNGETFSNAKLANIANDFLERPGHDRLCFFVTRINE